MTIIPTLNHTPNLAQCNVQQGRVVRCVARFEDEYEDANQIAKWMVTWGEGGGEVGLNGGDIVNGHLDLVNAE